MFLQSQAATSARSGGGRADSPPRIHEQVRGEYPSDTEEIPGGNYGSAAGSKSGRSGSGSGNNNGAGSARGTGPTNKNIVGVADEDSDASSDDQEETPPSSPGNPNVPGGAGPINPGLTGVPPKDNTYNPAAYARMQIPDDVAQLFEYIQRFVSHGKQ
jgi:hypothetical protein